MTREEQVQYWLDIADYDLDTAEAMHQTGRWLYVAFMCHQVIEKTLKGNQTTAAMDKRQTLTRDEALELVRRYKEVIRPRFEVEPKVMMFGSYSKGYANPDSDIDVAVIVPTYGGSKFEISKKLWRAVREVSFLIEPVLMAEDRQSPLYHDVMRTGVAV